MHFVTLLEQSSFLLPSIFFLKKEDSSFFPFTIYFIILFSPKKMRNTNTESDGAPTSRTSSGKLSLSFLLHNDSDRQQLCKSENASSPGTPVEPLEPQRMIPALSVTPAVTNRHVLGAPGRAHANHFESYPSITFPRYSPSETLAAPHPVYPLLSSRTLPSLPVPFSLQLQQPQHAVAYGVAANPSASLGVSIRSPPLVSSPVVEQNLSPTVPKVEGKGWSKRKAASAGQSVFQVASVNPPTAFFYQSGMASALAQQMSRKKPELGEAETAVASSSSVSPPNKVRRTKSCNSVLSAQPR